MLLYLPSLLCDKNQIDQSFKSPNVQIYIYGRLP